jgi:cytochrome c5
MKREIQIRLLPAVLMVLAGPMLLAQSATTFKPAAKAPAKATGKIDATKVSDVGQRKFQANCGRCHAAPEQLSPSISGTVVRHMRVRANLSAQDEKDILKFLVP